MAQTNPRTVSRSVVVATLAARSLMTGMVRGEACSWGARPLSRPTETSLAQARLGVNEKPRSREASTIAHHYVTGDAKGLLTFR